MAAMQELPVPKALPWPEVIKSTPPPPKPTLYQRSSLKEHWRTVLCCGHDPSIPNTGSNRWCHVMATKDVTLNGAQFQAGKLYKLLHDRKTHQLQSVKSKRLILSCADLQKHGMYALPTPTDEQDDGK